VLIIKGTYLFNTSGQAVR